MYTLIKVRRETCNALKTYLEEHHDFSSLDEAIQFLMKKEELFEIVLVHAL